MSRRRVLPFSVKRLTDWDAAAAACSEGVPQSSCKQVAPYHPRGACGVSKRRPELCSPNGTAVPFFATFLGKQKSRYTVAFVQGKSPWPISGQNSPEKIFFQKGAFSMFCTQCKTRSGFPAGKPRLHFGADVLHAVRNSQRYSRREYPGFLPCFSCIGRRAYSQSRDPQ